MDYFYSVILSNVILMSLVNIYFNRIIYRGQAYYKVQFLFLCFIICHSAYICVAKYFFSQWTFVDIGAPFELFYGPFFYLGMTALISDNAQDLKKELKHFILGILFFFIFFVLLIFFRDNAILLKYYLVLMYSVVCIQMLLYTFLAYSRFNTVVRGKRPIALMSQSMILMISTSLIFLTFVFSDLRERSGVINGFVIYLLMLGAVIIMFRYNLLILVKKFDYYKKSYTGKMFFDYFKANPGEDIEEKAEEAIPNTEEEVVKYQKSRISEIEMIEYMESLNKAFDSKVYLNSDLTLETLAKTTRIPKYHLTQVFNLGLNSNFNKYINALRVQYAVQLLDDSKNQDTIEEIMMQSGFNSRSSFYRAFNVYYDVSPADYRKRASME